MATREQAAIELLKKGYSPDEVETMLDGMKKPAPAPTPTPQKRMASAEKPAGGPVGTVTKKAAPVAPAPKAPEVKPAAAKPVPPPPGDAYMDTTGATIGRGVRDIVRKGHEIDKALVAGVRRTPVVIDEAARDAARYTLGAGFLYGAPGSDWREKQAATFDRADADLKRNAIGLAKGLLGTEELADDVKELRAAGYKTEDIAGMTPEVRTKRLAAARAPGDAYMDSPVPVASPERAPDDRSYLLGLGATAESLAAYDDAAIAKMAATQRAKASASR